VDRKRLAKAHRLVAQGEHGVERRMLEHADALPDPEEVRERAHSLSRNADRHLDEAERLEEQAERVEE